LICLKIFKYRGLLPERQELVCPTGKQRQTKEIIEKGKNVLYSKVIQIKKWKRQQSIRKILG
jgi:hypothetical protein